MYFADWRPTESTFHISTSTNCLEPICKYRLLGKSKVSKFELGTRFTGGVEEVFRFQVPVRNIRLSVIVKRWHCYCSYLSIYNLLIGHLWAMFISWRCLTAKQISFMINAASFSVKASWWKFRIYKSCSNKTSCWWEETLMEILSKSSPPSMHSITTCNFLKTDSQTFPLWALIPCYTNNSTSNWLKRLRIAEGSCEILGHAVRRVLGLLIDGQQWDDLSKWENLVELEGTEGAWKDLENRFDNSVEEEDWKAWFERIPAGSCWPSTEAPPE